MAKEIILSTDHPEFKLLNRGKVRDIYDFGENLLIVSTDRISAFDSVFPNGIPEKGMILNQISKYWFNRTTHIIKNHMVKTGQPSWHEDRAMFCKKVKPLPIECIVRGHLDGSLWQDYQITPSNFFGMKTLSNGYVLGKGAKQFDKLSAPIFTPSTKAEEGHDINISLDKAKEIVGEDIFNIVQRVSIDLYNFAYQELLGKDITLFDTKFEFGVDDNGEVIFIDEAFTPDSSRFCVIDEETGDYVSLDKQFIRNWATGIGWDKNPPAPQIPENIVEKTYEKYNEIYKRIVG